MSGHGEKLTRKKEQAIAALLAKPTIAEAAQASGVAESTIRRWLKEATFLDAYMLARRQVMAVALNGLCNACESAVQTLQDVMLDSSAPPSSRIASARTILDVVIKVCEQEDLETRIARLEHITSGEKR